MLRAQRSLVLDDEPPVELVRGCLAREGFEIVTASTGRQTSRRKDEH
jgi:hypothetical protein